MKVIINTTDGKEVTLTERTKEEERKVRKDKMFTYDITYAVMQVGQLELEFHPQELSRAINAM